MKRFIQLFFLAICFFIGGQFLAPSNAEASPTCVVREYEGDEHNGFWCFAIGADSALWTISYDQDVGDWNAWRSLRGAYQGELSCNGAAVRDQEPVAPVDPNPDDDLYPLGIGAPEDYYRCYARALDGSVRMISRPSPSVTLPGAFAGSPECHAVQCFIRAGDNTLHRTFRNSDSSWQAWTNLGGTSLSDPECVQSPRRVDCFVRNSNNALSHIACLDRAPCAGWANLDGVFTGRPSCVSATVDAGRGRRVLARIDCFVRGTDNTVFQKTYNGATWNAWQRVGTRTVTGDPECVALSDFRTLCFARNEGGYLISATREGDRWTEWTLAGNIALADQPSCFFRPIYNGAHCVGRGTSGRMVHTQVIFGGSNVTTEIGTLMLRE